MGFLMSPHLLTNFEDEYYEDLTVFFQEIIYLKK